jgi:hypothetical protein
VTDARFAVPPREACAGIIPFGAVTPSRETDARLSAVELVERILAGDRRAVARAISMVEDGAEDLPELSAGLFPSSGRARTVGLTGAPGVGKSTLAGELVRVARSRGLSAAVLAIDPTSPFTGGALLGDRVRMQDHATDPGVFIRSMAPAATWVAWRSPRPRPCGSWTPRARTS